MSNYTQLGLIKQTDGENEGTWGDKLNDSLIDLLDDAIGGYVEVSVASSNVTLAFADGTADNNGRHAVIKFTGSPGTTRTVTFPDAQVNYFIINGSDGSVICTSGGGAATVTIPTGMKDIIYVDGSDEVLSMLATPNLTASADLTLDAADDIHLDAAGNTWKFLTNTTLHFYIESNSGEMSFVNESQDLDQLFKGNDGGNAITALKLDMSEAGAATFNDKVIATELDISGNMDIDGTANLDNTDIDGTLAVDGTTISLDASTSLNIDNSNTSNGITIATATSGVPISIGHATSETTVNDNLTVTGTLTGTLATAAQGSVTSLGTLTTLTVDNVNVNGTTIGHTSDTDLLTFADGLLTVAGEISVTTLDIGGTNVTSTAAELNILDGVTSTAAELNILDGVTSTAAELNILDGVTSTASELNLIDGGTARGTDALADGDGILINDGGTMKMTNVTAVKTYMAGTAASAGFAVAMAIAL